MPSGAQKAFAVSLAERSAACAGALRDFMRSPENADSQFYIQFDRCFRAFKQALNEETSLSEFCDMYAQALVCDSFLDQPAGSTTNTAFYLYEDFLAAFDRLRGTENRKRGGVYYTPAPAADFIVRSVNFLIQDRLGAQEGFAAKNVKTLDFACGTGTFLHSLINLLLTDGQNAARKKSLKEKFLNDVYGFEISLPPCLAAHTFLRQCLRKKGIILDEKEHPAIYLTDTLDISETSEAARIPPLPEGTVLAVVGNPPWYGGKRTAGKSRFDQTLMPDYKKGLHEKNLGPLSDIYIKFIRFAEWKIAQAGQGAAGIITNNSWINGFVHRQMRKHLYETFDEIYILNLHGDTDRGEPDKNLFNIKRGNQISFFVKKKKPAAKKRVYYFSTLEQGILGREDKFQFLAHSAFADLVWKQVCPLDTKNYWFSPKDFSLKKTYDTFWKITDIFACSSTCIKTGCDAVTLHFSRESLDALRRSFQEQPLEEIRKKYRVKDSRDWRLSDAGEDILTDYSPKIITYRPFDERWTSLSKKSRRFLAYPCCDIMRHFDLQDNVGLLFKRGLSRDYFPAAFVSGKPAESILLESAHGSAYIAPLYLCVDGRGGASRRPNLSERFESAAPFAAFSVKPSPEELLAYIYAILYSPVYRGAYLAFLKTDVPAVPITRDEAVFKQYAALGQRLIDLHLLKKVPDDAGIIIAPGGGGVGVVKRYWFENSVLTIETGPAADAPASGRITFEGIAREVWDFTIGAYRPVEKWIGYRRRGGVMLGPQDLTHIRKMLAALKETLTIMADLEKFSCPLLQAGRQNLL
jgi:predicted helicase